LSRWLKRIRGGIYGWMVRRKIDREFTMELAAHLELLTAEYVRRGMTAENARRCARLKIGGTQQLREMHLQACGLPAVESVVQDVRYALRTLCKKPGFTAVCVLTLGLGIGATTAVFSVINSVLLRPLPYPNAERLLQIQESHPGESNRNFTYANYFDLEQQSQTLQNISAFRPWSFNLTGQGEPQEIAGAMVSGKFFPALGTQAGLGRTISEEDNQLGGDNKVVVLSYGLWQSGFGSEGGILGRVVHISSENFRVIGVMPKGFEYPSGSRLWTPLIAGSLRENRRAHLLSVIADVAPGKGAGAQAEMGAIAERIEKQNPAIDPDMLITAVSLQKSLIAPVQPALLILTAAVSLLMLLACANLANLLLVQAKGRQKEFAIRISIGAGRRRLLRQLVTESVLLAMLGAALGLAVAWQSLRFIIVLDAGSMPRFEEISMDWRVLGFTLLVSLCTGILFGLAPAMVAARTDVNTVLKEAASNLAGGKRTRLWRALAVPQFALAMVLLAGAGLVGNSFARLLRVNPGFNPSGVMTMSLFLSPSEQPEAEAEQTEMLRQILENVRGVSGVRSAGLVNALPITGGPNTDFMIEGRPVPPPSNEPSAAIRTVDEGYFHTMGIPLLAGREITKNDAASSQKVMVINQSMAREYWPRENPIGQRVTMKDWGPPLTGEIVGIVGDVKTNGLDSEAGSMIYWPYAQFPQLFNTLVFRSVDDPKRQMAAVKSAIWAVAKDQPISRIGTLEEVLAESLARRRLYMILLGFFSCAALLLAAIGIYGVVSYSVSRRIHEMGIRLAIGAEPKNVLWLVLGQGAGVALAGIAIGIAAAMALTRWLSSLLFEIQPTDPQTFVGVAVLLLLVALATSYIPARRATRVDPLFALRYE
jgi:predicted permease